MACGLPPPGSHGYGYRGAPAGLARRATAATSDDARPPARRRRRRRCPLADILPLLEQANVGGFVLPFTNPRHQHKYRVLQQFPLADDQIIAASVIDDLT